jgi:benzoyl-CoA reductase/2-hydroxyglutaryl-CoA dehydratase subunit BcrC/BadD/HgdB
MKVSTTHLDYEEKIDISYVVSQLMFENDSDKFRERMKEYNNILRNNAIKRGEKTCQQVSIVGIALLVDEEPIGEI